MLPSENTPASNFVRPLLEDCHCLVTLTATDLGRQLASDVASDLDRDLDREAAVRRASHWLMPVADLAHAWRSVGRRHEPRGAEAVVPCRCLPSAALGTHAESLQEEEKQAAQVKLVRELDVLQICSFYSTDTPLFEVTHM